MRIIGGKAKGKRIKALDSRSVRPLTDFAREALFNILTPIVGGSRFLDLFAGSGAVAIEALSRGAEQAVLVEKNPKCAALIRQNLSECGFTGQAQVFSIAADQALKILSSSNEKFDIIFIGAPYGSPDFVSALKHLSSGQRLKSNGRLIAEHHFKTIIADEIGALKRFRQERYGDTMLSFYEVSK